MKIRLRGRFGAQNGQKLKKAFGPFRILSPGDGLDGPTGVKITGYVIIFLRAHYIFNFFERTYSDLMFTRVKWLKALKSLVTKMIS